MAGGAASDPGLTDSILEVPTFTIALVFVFFLVVSLAFEYGVRFLSRKFEEHGRPGLVEALSKLVLEVTLLGFVSLLLITFQNSLNKLCVGYSNAAVSWTLMDNIAGCPCCLASTAGVSTCAQIAHSCQFGNITSDYAPYCNCGLEPSPDDDCFTYREAELSYFISQAPGSVAMYASVDRLVSENSSAALLCDGFCDIINETWAYIDNITGYVSASAGGGRRLQELSMGANLALETTTGSLTLQAQEPAGPALLELGPEPAAQQPHRRLLAAATPVRAGNGTSNATAANVTADLAAAGAKQSNYSRDEVTTVADQVMGVVNSSGVDPETNSADYLIPKAKVFSCTGPFLSGSCSAGQFPAISQNALHQIHLWLFLTAIMHVITSILLVVLSGYRLRQWRRWQVAVVRVEEAADDLVSLPSSRNGFGAPVGDAALPGSPASSSASPTHSEPAAAPSHPSFSRGKSGTEAPEGEGEGDENGEPKPQPVDEGAQALAVNGTAGSAPSLAANGGSATERPPAPIIFDTAVRSLGSSWASLSPGSGSNGGRAARMPPPLKRQLSRQATVAANTWAQLQNKWVRRSTMLHRKRDRWFEWATVLVQAFMPNLVRRHQFLLIRSAYIACADPPQPFDFTQHMRLCLERDAARVVGLSLEMWLTAILWILISGLVNWSGTLMLWTAAGLLLAVNLTLVAMLRYATRGSAPALAHDTKRLLFGWLRAELLLIPIRMVLFLCSLVFSSQIFFAWQFGSSSCFFTKYLDLWSAAPGLSWWSGLVAALIILLYISLVTLPAWTLAVHATHSPEQDMQEEVEHLPAVAQALLRQASIQHQAEAAHAAAEMEALAEECQRLRALLGQAGGAASRAPSSAALQPVPE